MAAFTDYCDVFYVLLGHFLRPDNHQRGVYSVHSQAAPRALLTLVRVAGNVLYEEYRRSCLQVSCDADAEKLRCMPGLFCFVVHRRSFVVTNYDS